jgi:hypothetical protein
MLITDSCDRRSMRPPEQSAIGIEQTFASVRVWSVARDQSVGIERWNRSAETDMRAIQSTTSNAAAFRLLRGCASDVDRNPHLTVGIASDDQLLASRGARRRHHEGDASHIRANVGKCARLPVQHTLTASHDRSLKSQGLSCCVTILTASSVATTVPNEITVAIEVFGNGSRADKVTAVAIGKLVTIVFRTRRPSLSA